MYEKIKKLLLSKQYTWLITGVAGFIGSNLLETLLRNGQRVIGLDNFATGYRENMEDVRTAVTQQQWENFQLLEGDIRLQKICNDACIGADYVLHQAGLGSVPRSLQDPIATNSVNIDGFLNMLVASRDAGVKRFVYAASSSTYGDHPGLPKVEDFIGKALSPYAVTKYVNELYANVFALCYGLQSVGLRYFNAFGPRQDPDGAYAAVIPKWIASMIQGTPVYINGDGETSRDFCYVVNVVMANLLAATTDNKDAVNQVYNIAVGERTTLNQLFEYLRTNLVTRFSHLQEFHPIYRDFRVGDVRHSLADIGKAKRLLMYQPTHRVIDGLSEAMEWYVQKARK